MVIQHNISAVNTNRMLGITNRDIADSAQKLSSGYKVNIAADDAAGLSISEKMRKQIRGLNQASESRIRDTDMAKQMVRFSNLNILSSSGNSMLAQANQSKNGILTLLSA